MNAAGGLPDGKPDLARSPRRFTLADGMILIVGVATGLALIRHEQARRSTAMQFAILYGSGICIGLSLAHLAIRLLPPRPPWRVLSRRIGTTAALLVPCLLTLQTTIILLAEVWHPCPQSQLLQLDDLAIMIGLAVLGHWVVQFLSRSVHRRGDWVEWTGRLLGLSWIALLMVYLWANYS